MYQKITAVQISEINNISLKMTKGAAIREEAPAGIAFQAEINAPDELLHSDAVTTGMLISYDDIVEEEGDGNLTVNSGFSKANIVNDGWFDRDLGVYRAGVCGIARANYIRDFVSRGYIQLHYTDGTTSEPIYAKLSDTRSISQVAQAIIAAGHGNDFIESCVE